MIKYIISFALFASVLLLACNQSAECNNSNAQVINPNGDSELALLMRAMFEDGQRMRRDIMEGRKPEILKEFKEIHTAEATEPEKAASEAYQLYADAYLNSLNMLEKAEMDELHDSYRAMVESCMNCHRAMCPGPIVKIKKLKLPEVI